MRHPQEHWSKRLKHENAELTKQMNTLKHRISKYEKVEFNEKGFEQQPPNDPENGGDPLDSGDDDTPKFITVLARIFTPHDLKQRVRVFDNDQTFGPSSLTKISAFKMKLFKTQNISSDEYEDNDMFTDYINGNESIHFVCLPSSFRSSTWNLMSGREMTIVEQFGGFSKAFTLKNSPGI